MTPAPGTTRHGYTLVEIMISIAVVGILAAAAVPLFQPDVAQQLEAFGQIVAADLLHARDLATTNNSKYRLTFERAENRFYLEHTGANSALNTLPATIYRHAANTPARQYTDLDDLPQLGSGATIETLLSPESPPAAVTTVEFGPLGATTQTAETVVWLSSGAGDGKRYLAVRINPITGLASPDEITAVAPATGAGS
jgi:prepilin-type N-terminal cleavage/methylation domain-containing protein